MPRSVAQEGIMNLCKIKKNARLTLPPLQAGGPPVTDMRLELNAHLRNNEQIIVEAAMMACETTLETIGYCPEQARRLTWRMVWNLGSLSTLSAEEITTLCGNLCATGKDNDNEDDNTNPWMPWINVIVCLYC
jgi:hypothetical protein